MKTITLSIKAQEKLQRFFSEGKIAINDFSDTSHEVDTFLSAMGFRPMYGRTSVSYALNKRKETQNAECSR